MIIGITINNIVRNHLDKLTEAYQIVTGKDPVTPIDPYNLDVSFPKIDETTTESEFNPDQPEMELIDSNIDTSFDVYEFMYHDASFEIFGRSELTSDNILNKLSNLQSKDLRIVLLNKETTRSKCATLFFLSKNSFDFDKIIFPDDYKDFWKNCDVLVTDNPKIMKKKPKNKILVKYQNDFNIDYPSEFTIFNITDLENIMDDIKNLYNDKKLNKNKTK